MMRYLLFSQKFLPLFLTQFFGAFNDNAFKTAFLIWFTFQVTSYHGVHAEMMVTFASGLFILPFFLFSAFAGQLADKYERSALVVKIKSVEVLLMCLMGLSFLTHSVLGLLCLVFMMGAQSTFFGPIKYSLLPSHLEKSQLISANGFISGGTFVAILLGTILAGSMLTFQNGTIYLSLILIFFALIGLISSLAIPKAEIASPQLKLDFYLLHNSISILKMASQNKNIWFLIIRIAWFWFIGITFLTQFPIYTKEILKGNEQIITLILAVLTLGIGSGAGICRLILKTKISNRLNLFSLIGISLSIFVFVYLSQEYQTLFYKTQMLYHHVNLSLNIKNFLTFSYLSYYICLSIFSISVFTGIYIVPLYAELQITAPKEKISRIIAATNIVDAFFMILASLYALTFYALHQNVLTILLSLAILNLFIPFIQRGKRRGNNV